MLIVGTMSNGTSAFGRTTDEEYLAMERASHDRHELIDGVVYAMSGGSITHARIATNLMLAFGNALQGRPCRPFGSDLKVRVETRSGFLYPDLSVICGQPEVYDDEKDVALNPTVIVEVLSPSTERYDRVVKFSLYREIPTLREYVLVSQDEPRVERFRRENDQWIFDDATSLEGAMQFHSIDVAITLRDVYDGVPFTPAEPEGPSG